MCYISSAKGMCVTLRVFVGKPVHAGPPPNTYATAASFNALARGEPCRISRRASYWQKLESSGSPVVKKSRGRRTSRSQQYRSLLCYRAGNKLYLIVPLPVAVSGAAATRSGCRCLVARSLTVNRIITYYM